MAEDLPTPVVPEPAPADEKRTYIRSQLHCSYLMNFPVDEKTHRLPVPVLITGLNDRRNAVGGYAYTDVTDRLEEVKQWFDHMAHLDLVANNVFSLSEESAGDQGEVADHFGFEVALKAAVEDAARAEEADKGQTITEEYGADGAVDLTTGRTIATHETVGRAPQSGTGTSMAGMGPDAAGGGSEGTGVVSHDDSQLADHATGYNVESAEARDKREKAQQDDKEQHPAPQPTAKSD